MGPVGPGVQITLGGQQEVEHEEQEEHEEEHGKRVWSTGRKAVEASEQAAERENVSGPQATNPLCEALLDSGLKMAMQSPFSDKVGRMALPLHNVCVNDVEGEGLDGRDQPVHDRPG